MDGIDLAAAALARNALTCEYADLPVAMDQLMAVAMAPGGLPAVLAGLVGAARSAIRTAAAGDPERVDMAIWELEQVSEPTE